MSKKGSAKDMCWSTILIRDVWYACSRRPGHKGRHRFIIDKTEARITITWEDRYLYGDRKDDDE